MNYVNIYDYSLLRIYFIIIVIIIEVIAKIYATSPHQKKYFYFIFINVYLKKKNWSGYKNT